MAKFYDAGPDDPMYREGPQSYTHWLRPFVPSKRPTSPKAEPEAPAPVEAEKERE